MRLLLGLLLAFAVASIVGLGTTFFALSHGMAFGAFSIGAWTAWPRTGTADIDPYARAVLARTGELPMGSGDGIAFFAGQFFDDDHVVGGDTILFSAGFNDREHDQRASTLSLGAKYKPPAPLP